MAGGWRVVEGTQVVLRDVVYGSGEVVPFDRSEEDEAERSFFEKVGWIEPVGGRKKN